MFAKQINSANFIKYLKNKGFNAASFFNPIKKYYYVYIVKSNNKEEVEDLKVSKFNNSYSADMWVLSVNNSKQSSSITQKSLKKGIIVNNSPCKKEA